MNKNWLVMIVVGILTFLMRLSFVVLAERWQPPEWLTRALRYVPIAVLTAIFIPDMVAQDQTIVNVIVNSRFIAGLAAILIAWRTKNTILTISFGMAIFWGLNWLL